MGVNRAFHRRNQREVIAGGLKLMQSTRHAFKQVLREHGIKPTITNMFRQMRGILENYEQQRKKGEANAKQD